MKLIVNENFQFRGMHRAGTTLTVPESVLEAEIEKGKHPNKIRGRHRWLSGLLEHCTPANQETSDFIELMTDEKFPPVQESGDEEDHSDEIRDIRAEFDLMGKAYDKRWQIKRLRDELVKAKREFGSIRVDGEKSNFDIKE